MDAVSAIGWTSSLILILTLGQQVHRQWQSQDSRGVSPWLFWGQLLASVGFTTYSLLLKNWVFSATNGVLLLSAICGQLVTLRNRRLTQARERSAFGMTSGRQGLASLRKA